MRRGREARAKRMEQDFIVGQGTLEQYRIMVNQLKSQIKKIKG